MGKTITTSELINAAIAAENTARDIYLAFKQMFEHRPDIADFWRAMAHDEEEHARVLARVHGLVSVKDLTCPVDASAASKAYQLQSIDIDSMLDSVNNLNDAYQVAYTLESSEVNTVFNFLAINFLPSEESYKIISASISPHLLRLAEFTRTFGSAEQCRKVPALKGND